MQTNKVTHLISSICCLIILGFIAIYAASAMKGLQQYNDSFIFLRKQLFACFLACSLGLILLKTPFSWFYKLTIPLLFISAISLILVFVPGFSGKAGGASRWVNLIFFRFQPSELVKIAFIFFLAKNFSRKTFDINDIMRGFLPTFCVFLFFSVLLLKQPDLGSVILMGTIFVSMAFCAGLKLKYLAAALASASVALFFLILLAPYRLKRLTSFLDPWSQVREGGFQIIQSLLAFKNGGLAGVGLGESKQKLYFLPEAHTDFILAVLGEELGFLGLLFISTLYLIVSYQGFKITLAQPTPFRKYLAFGLTASISMQALINMGVAMGLLPTKGLPLPFISSGANSLIGSILVIFMLLRLAIEPSKHNNPWNDGTRDSSKNETKNLLKA